MDALSDNILLGSDFLLANLLKASRKLSTVRSCTISKCTALVEAHVNKHMYTFLSSSPFLTCNAPVKSTPVTVNGGHSVTRTLGKGGGLGALYGFPDSLLHVTHWRSNFLTRCRMEGIQ